MVELIHQYRTLLPLADGRLYAARVYADRQPSGLWEAWFVFFPLETGAALATDRETTQSKREDVVYWATGITPTYLEGALRRAVEALPETRLARRMAWAEQEEAYARAEADAYRAAAEEARAWARASAAERRAAEAELEDRRRPSPAA
jgi:hypothetical protein